MIVFRNHIKFHMSLNDWSPPPPAMGNPHSNQQSLQLDRWCRSLLLGAYMFLSPFSLQHLAPNHLVQGKLEEFCLHSISSNWVLICEDDGIIDFYISALCAPFLSWHELRKNISVPSLPKGDDNLLTELKPMVWIFHVAKWPLRNSVGCCTKYDVVWT